MSGLPLVGGGTGQTVAREGAWASTHGAGKRDAPETAPPSCPNPRHRTGVEQSTSSTCTPQNGRCPHLFACKTDGHVACIQEDGDTQSEREGLCSQWDTRRQFSQQAGLFLFFLDNFCQF